MSRSAVPVQAQSMWIGPYQRILKDVLKPSLHHDASIMLSIHKIHCTDLEHFLVLYSGGGVLLRF